MNNVLSKFKYESSRKLYRRKYKNLFRLPPDFRWTIIIRKDKKYLDDLFGKSANRSAEEINNLVEEFLNR